MAFDMIDTFHELSRDKKIKLSAYIMRRFAEKRGIPIAEHHRDIDTDMHKVTQEKMGTIKEIWKRKMEFFWFSLSNYGMIPVFTKNDKMSIMKVPDKTLDKILDILKSGRELTQEEMKEILNEVQAETNKEKA